MVLDPVIDFQGFEHKPWQWKYIRTKMAISLQEDFWFFKADCIDWIIHIHELKSALKCIAVKPIFCFEKHKWNGGPHPQSSNPNLWSNLIQLR